jgi:hypothetical protein
LLVYHHDQMQANAAGTTVTLIELSNCNLTGTLSPLIGAFVDTTLFHVYSNELPGTTPVSIGKWRKIDDFAVHVNHFSGLLPAMAFSAMPDDGSGCLLLWDNPITNLFACPWPAGAKDKCTKGGGTPGAPITDGDCHGTAPPTPLSYKCTEGQCVASGGLSLADCKTVCAGQLYQCVSNKCTPATTGLPQATCEANCGPSPRGVVALK